MAYTKIEPETLYFKAESRVCSDERLDSVREFVLADWPEGEEHWAWVIEATTEEILDWVDASKQQASGSR
ncbi:MAG: hypothetical protein GWN93_06825 [Deltaproteobacteria bacterium]|nr:hypothetical protein [Deltaproteobacteria bacterium]